MSSTDLRAPILKTLAYYFFEGKSITDVVIVLFVFVMAIISEDAGEKSVKCSGD